MNILNIAIAIFISGVGIGIMGLLIGLAYILIKTFKEEWY